MILAKTASESINQVSALLMLSSAYVPVAYKLVQKIQRTELKARKTSWMSERTKSEMFRDMARVSVQNKIRFNCVLCDSWHTNSKNIKHVLHKYKQN